jgi:regulator of cell morphogenesis and NO signaling
MDISGTTTIGELASELPQAARVFEQYGIDYCCGGETPLKEACKIKNVDLDEILKAVEQSAPAGSPSPENYSTLSQARLVDHIVNTHHTFTRAELHRLELLAQKVISVHGMRHRELVSVQKLLKDIADDLLPHLVREENMLFPYIVGLESAAGTNTVRSKPGFFTVKNPVRMMMFEHDLVGELLRGLRRVTLNYTVPDDGCASYRTLYAALETLEQDLHQHIHLENNILFPRAVEMESQAS